MNNIEKMGLVLMWIAVFWPMILPELSDVNRVIAVVIGITGMTLFQLGERIKEKLL